MRDRGQFWTPVPDWASARIEGDGVRVEAVAAGQILLVSGEVGVFLGRRGVGPSLGPRDAKPGDTYALRLAPDRVLYVSAAVEPIDRGWSAAGCAVTGMTDGMILCDVSGPRALELLQQGTSYDLKALDERPNEFVQHPLRRTSRCNHPPRRRLAAPCRAPLCDRVVELVSHGHDARRGVRFIP